MRRWSGWAGGPETLLTAWDVVLLRGNQPVGGEGGGSQPPFPAGSRIPKALLPTPRYNPFSKMKTDIIRRVSFLEDPVAFWRGGTATWKPPRAALQAPGRQSPQGQDMVFLTSETCRQLAPRRRSPGD